MTEVTEVTEQDSGLDDGRAFRSWSDRLQLRLSHLSTSPWSVLPAYSRHDVIQSLWVGMANRSLWKRPSLSGNAKVGWKDRPKTRGRRIASSRSL